MSKPTVLVADADPRSLGMIEVALKKAGFTVTAAASASIEQLRKSTPDLAILDVEEGVKLCKAVRADAKLSAVPVVILGAEKSHGSRAIDAGADEFIAKPVLLKDLVHRARSLIERRQQTGKGGEALQGSVRDLGLLDLFQRLLADGKSAAVTCEAYGREARVWVKDGQIVDAEFGALQGEGALWRLMTWETGAFYAELIAVDREARIEGGTQAALAAAMKKVEELAAEELPMSSILVVDAEVLLEKLSDLPDEVNGVIRCFDGKRTLREGLDLAPVDDLAAVTVLRKLLADGILKPVQARKPSLNDWLASEVTPAPKTLDEARAAAALVAEMVHAESAELQRVREQEEAAAAAVAARAQPAIAVKPVPVIHFPPLRGVRRERLRREAEEARARIGQGKPLRLSHVVELPPRVEAEALGAARTMSPAVGEAAKRYAPDTPVARLRVPLEQPKTDPAEAPAVVATPPIAPIAAPTPVPEVPAVQAIAPGTPPPDRALEQALLETVEKKRRRFWPVYAAATAAVLAGAWYLRPQPRTDKKDAPWLEAKPVEPVKPAQPQPPPPAAVPEAPPQVVVAAVTPPPPDDTYEKALQEGNDHFGRGKWKAAIAAYQRAVKQQPQSVPALLALGDAYLESDRPRSAVPPLEAAVRADPSSSRAHLLLGTAYQSLGRNKAAAKSYQRYVEIEPDGEFVKDVRLILANLAHSR